MIEEGNVQGRHRPSESAVMHGTNFLNYFGVVSPDGQLHELAASGLLSTPTSVAFGEGRFQRTLFICNNGDFFPGADSTLAGLLKIDVGAPACAQRPVRHRHGRLPRC